MVIRTTIRTVRYTLSALIAVLTAATLATLCLGFALPYSAQLDGDRSSWLSRQGKKDVPPIGLPELAELERVCQQPLQRPLFDPPASAPVVAQAPPPPSVRLVGTIIEPGRSMAVLTGPRGKTELRSAGDFVSDTGNTLLLVEVEMDQVVLKHLDKEIVVRLERPATATLIGRR